MRLVIPAVLLLTWRSRRSPPPPGRRHPGHARRTPGRTPARVDETVLTPLFLRISGVEGMTRIESEARNDGTGTVTVSFHPTADLDLAEVRVHNRVSLALPKTP